MLRKEAQGPHLAALDMLSSSSWQLLCQRLDTAGVEMSSTNPIGAPKGDKHTNNKR